MTKDKRLLIDMCAGSEIKDTQGETLSIDGADITELENGSGRLNDNHGKGFFNSIGRVTSAKKIFKSEDCENDRHRYYWEKIKAPYIYVAGELYNDEDHPNARAAAAILRNIHRDDVPLKMKASVEGGVVSRGITDPSRLARTKIHSVALTFTPANNATLVEPINLDKTDTNWELDCQLIRSVMHLAETNIPSFRHIERHASANTIYDNLNKIKELAETLGINIDVKSTPQEIINGAISNKIANNIFKMRDLVKNIKKLPESYQGTYMSTTPAKEVVAENVFKRHAVKALRNPSHIKTVESGLINAGVHPEKIKVIMNKINSHMKKSLSDTMKDALIKSNRNNQEELDKSFKQAVAGLGMMAGLMAPNSTDTLDYKPPKQLIAPKQTSKYLKFGQNPNDGFLYNVMQKETSGGKNFSHRTVKEGTGKGHEAIGAFALMPNTIHEIANRHRLKGGKNNEILNLLKINPLKYKEHLQRNPDLYLELARDLANHVIKKHGGINHKSAYAWLYGHNIPSDKIPTDAHKDPYVADFLELNRGKSVKGLVPASKFFSDHSLSSTFNNSNLMPSRDVAGFSKSLTAGYGSAGIPMDMTGGSILQTESINDGKIKKKIKKKILKTLATKIPQQNINSDTFKKSKLMAYICCDDCGDEQVYMRHQVRCRKCGHSFNLHKLKDFI